MKDKTIINLEDRVPKLKEQKRRKANFRLMMTIGFFFFLLVFVIFFQSSLGKISKVEIVGNEYMTEERILTITGLKNKPNYFNVSQEELQKQLKNEDEIKEAKVEKKFPNKVQITIVEEKTVAFVKMKNHYVPVLGNGVVLLSNTDVKQFEAPIISGLSLEDEEFDDFIKELNLVPLSIIRTISEVHYVPAEDKLSELMLYMSEGFVVKTTIHDFSKKMSYYPAIMKNIDINNKGTIYLDVGAYFEPNSTSDEEVENTNDETPQ